MRVLVTVGAQMPFDRLVSAVDAWARERGRDDVFAQIADSASPPHHIAYKAFLSPEEYRERVEEASCLVAHAGMGSILTALEYGKPIVVMPRRGDLEETRNDHQIATANAFAERGLIRAVFSGEELTRALDGLDHVEQPEAIPCHAPQPFLDALRNFALEGRR